MVAWDLKLVEDLRIRRIHYDNVVTDVATAGNPLSILRNKIPTVTPEAARRCHVDIIWISPPGHLHTRKNIVIVGRYKALRGFFHGGTIALPNLRIVSAVIVVQALSDLTASFSP